MNATRVFVLAASVFLSTALAYPLTADAQRTLSGELVVLNGSKSQFRIVGHGGTFVAPAGTSLQALDGRTVRVELSSNGKVTQITDTPVAINPVVHGWSTVRGEVVVVDGINRRFTVAGDTQTYTAPAGVDVSLYAGKLVEFKVDEGGQVSELRLVAAAPKGSSLDDPYPPYRAAVPPVAPSTCIYGGHAYSPGAAICQAGMQFRCDGAQWQSLGTPCQISEARAPRRPSDPPRSCLVGGATVASGSGICRDGTTFRCDDGTWININSACR